MASPQLKAAALALAAALAAGVASARADEAEQPVVPHIVVTPAPKPLDDEEFARGLTYNPATLATGPARNFRALRTPEPRATWDGGRQDDGSTRVSVSKPLAPEWNIRAGADLTVPGDPATVYRPGGPPAGAPRGETQGGFWASAAVPHVADVQVRVDPGLAQNRLGADVQRTVPLGKNYSVTLQNRVAVTETGGAVPPPEGTPAQIWDTEQKLKFNVHATGTSLAAGTYSSSVDGVQHHSFSADQRVYGPLHVTGSVTDPGRDTSSQSIGANLKFTW